MRPRSTPPRATLPRWAVAFALSLAFLLGLFARPLHAQAPAATVDLVEAAGQRLVEGQPWTAVVAVIDTTGEAVVRGFGTGADGETPDGETIYEIGSVTKGFVGLLLAHAVEEGRLALDQPVADLLPDTMTVPRYGAVDSDGAAGESKGEPITLRDLATHQSGLPRLPTNFMLMVADMGNPYVYYDAAAFDDFLSGYQLPEPPGTRYAYSNAGFGLLSYALSRAADDSLGGLVQRHVAAPLGLDDLGTTLSAAQRARLAQGHTPDGQPTPPWQFQPIMAGAGDLHATADDLVTFLRFALDPDTTTALGQALRRATTPLAATDQPGIGVGYGWHLGVPDPSGQGNPRAAWHNGGTGGYSAFVGFDPDAGAGVIVLTGAAIYQDVTRTGFQLLSKLAQGTSSLPASE
jgi:CubicO group peptidase (beta-lactamase class C family)